MSAQYPEQWEKQLAGQPMRNDGFTSDIGRKVRERIRMGEQRNKSRGRLRTAAALTAIAVMLAGGWLFRENIGSMLNQKPEGMEGVPAALQNDVLADQDTTLRVMVGEYDNFVNSQYARPFLLHHPTVSIETSLMPQEKDVLEWVDKENPDVLRLSLQQYYELAKAGKLKPLDTLIKNDDVDVDAMYEPVIDILREYGGGQMYGLSPVFQTDAVFVNKELFEKNGIPLPHAGMTWDELLDTAARFQGTGTAGLVSSSFGDNPSSLVNKIAQATGLQTDTQDGKQVTIDSQAWADLWTKITHGYKDGWIYRDKEADKKSKVESFTASDPFLKGNAAMVVTSGYYVSQIQSAWGDDQKWITIPVPGNQMSSFYLQEIYAVSSTTSNDKAAWEMVKFMTGSEFAKRLIGTGMSQTPIRQSDAQQKYSEEQVAAFYQSKLELPQDWQNAAEGSPISNTLVGYAYQYSEPLLEEVIAGTLTVDQALAQLKEQLEQRAQQDALAAKKEKS
ncbi:multiple sugar transport system substrate-binding protein [Paenibacillus cellulosilyticus]|uniref:Multiple sugar transport system substrate-binding protein n=1 Tax=Paenibacillus cellulosilyticus TaxID=375489 RepID=A0A2V2YQU9_9BACL|nr:extracellular solute-binding protein [Paenibacillus cellulosilyticus]PWV97278.1 multiple sugar transport system substrate-binding protein [Paenibacillus cellulosilyticus]QKS47516.1 extracellular solute-binding protein [Paenibacillus cellulosilyticus]